LKESNQNEYIRNVPKLPKNILKNPTEFKQTAVEKLTLAPELTLPMKK
jgi:hypothetical protein